MAGRSPLVATAEQEAELRALSRSDVRGEADRSRAILLTLQGWTSLEVAEAFGVTPEAVRHWWGGSASAGWTPCVRAWRPARHLPRASGRLRLQARCCASRSRTDHPPLRWLFRTLRGGRSPPGMDNSLKA